MFKKVENTQAFFKACIYGDSGTGKTTLAQNLAINLAKLGNKKVFVIDTENGIDFFAKAFQDEGIECYCQQDNFANTTKKIDASIIKAMLQYAIEEKPDVIIIDSITNLGEIYTNQYNPKGVISSWGEVKANWMNDIIKPLRMANSHIIVCGRETSNVSITKETGGKMVIGEKDETKIKSGIDIDFELNLLIKTSRTKIDGVQTRVATILKDRTNTIDGQDFYNATFKDFEPHLQKLHTFSLEFTKAKNDLQNCQTLEQLNNLVEILKTFPEGFEKTTLGTLWKKQKKIIDNNNVIAKENETNKM